MPILLTIAGIPVIDHQDGTYSWTAGMAIDADGSPHAYHPISGKGLDALANAGKPGKWWGIVTDTGRPDGQPIIQRHTDPAPGYYVSATTLQIPGYQRTDPRRYLDSETIPYIVVPPQVRQQARGIVLGCRATITWKGRTCEAIVADIGPRSKIGEASIAAAAALGIPSDPRTGGTDSGVLYTIYPGRPSVFNLPLHPA